MTLIIFIFFLVCVGVLAYVAELLIQKFRPHIYLVPDKNVFLYSQGKRRVVFDYLSLYEGPTMSTDINNLFVGEYSNLKETASYVMLDRAGVLSAVLPFNVRSTDNRDREIALILPDNKKPKWLSAREFANAQGKLLAGIYE